MTLGLAGPLVVLALIDSTSIGTLVIPILLMLAPGRRRGGRIVLYLLSIAVFYLVLGVLIARGAGALVEAAGEALDGRGARWVQLALGVGLVAVSFRFGSGDGGEQKVSGWGERASRALESPRSLAGLAVVAGVLEVATMFPYLGAIALLTGAELPILGELAVLAGYCLVMILPALALLAVRTVLAGRIEPLLARIRDWFARHASATTGWVVAIVGVLLARDAAWRLGLFVA